MEKKRVIIVSVVVSSAVLLIAIYLFIRHTSTQENPTIRLENLKNGSHILTGEQCPCHGICVNGYTCHTRTECYNQHRAANSLDSLVMINCSANEGYVCCPPVPKRGKMDIPIRDPEVNKRLLPIGDCGQISFSRVLGGQPAQVGQFPWMALLAYRSSDQTYGPTQYLCGGTLISTRYILTAAHCLSIPRFGTPVHVRLGEFDVSVDPDCVGELYCAHPPVDVEVEKSIAHENYNDPYLKNDIALLRLKTEVNVTHYISPICLPFDLNITGEELTKYNVAGWGRTEDESLKGSDELRFAMVESIPVSECNEAVDAEVKPVNELQLCAGFDGKDACKGDSGGPLMTDLPDNVTGAATTYQIGIVSFGAPSCGTDVPSVYTRVSSYLRWILSNLEP